MTHDDSPPSGWAAIIAARMPRGATQRVRASRRLRRTGAVAVRPGVYALPDSAEGRAALASAAHEVTRQRGSALPCVLTWLDSSDEAKLRARYQQERNSRRQRVLKHIHDLERMLAPSSSLSAKSHRTAHARLARLRNYLDRAPTAAAQVGQSNEARLLVVPTTTGATPYRGRTWVTRRGVLVDRIASAWLIQRFIDREAQFRFVGPREPLASGELRFDMAEADFGHEGDRCTFETLVARFGANDPALRQLAEIIHDLDLRDGKYGRSEVPGVALVIAGLAAGEPGDAARISQGRWLFDSLYAAVRPGPMPRLPKGAMP